MHMYNKMRSGITIIYFFLALSSAFADSHLRQTQCNALPGICPQNCIITLGGCSHCVSSCASILGASFSNVQSQSGNPAGTNAGGTLSYNSQIPSSSSLSSNGGTSFLSPSSMNMNSLSGLMNYNPGNLGPLNPYLTSGFGSYGTGTNYNPANPNQLSGGGSSGSGASSFSGANSGGLSYQPSGYNGGMMSGPGSQLSGNPANPLSVHTTKAPPITTSVPTTTVRTTVTGPTHSCQPVNCPDIQYVHFINGCPVCIVPSMPPTTTTAKPTTQKVMTSVATCAPLRCVAPCDKGIGIGPTGCPICLCKRILLKPT